MPKFNADEQVFEAVEITLGGKTYVVDKIEQNMFDRIKEVTSEARESLDRGEEDVGVLDKQLGIILNEDPSVFQPLDLRRKTSAIRFLTETITSQVEGKTKNG